MKKFSLLTKCSRSSDCHPDPALPEKGIIKLVRSYFVYILTTKNNKMLYTGVTNNLQRRVEEHKQKFIPGYTEKYNLMINSFNPEWKDLS